MEKEILQRLEEIEKKVSTNKQDNLELMRVIISALIPLSIALIGWYFTNQHNKNQLVLQQQNADIQREIAMINATVGQSTLIKDFLPHLNSKDTSAQNIAMVAILYAAPGPGKEIVDIVAQSSTGEARSKAELALINKRKDLVNNLFSYQKQKRLIAASEISSNWNSDEDMLTDLLAKVNSCLENAEGSENIYDCSNGIYNVYIVLQNFQKDLLRSYKEKITEYVGRIDKSKGATLKQADKLLRMAE